MGCSPALRPGDCGVFVLEHGRGWSREHDTSHHISAAQQGAANVLSLPA